MEKFESNNIEPNNSEGDIEQKLESEKESIEQEFEKLSTNIKEIESFDLPKEEEQKVMRKIITKFEALQVLFVGMASGLAISQADSIKDLSQDLSPANVAKAVLVLGVSFGALYTTSLSIGRNRRD